MQKRRKLVNKWVRVFLYKSVYSVKKICIQSFNLIEFIFIFNFFKEILFAVCTYVNVSD
jgi:hypothetical protein